MVWCIKCKHYQETDLVEGDFCNLFEDILTEDMIWEGECDGYVPLDADDTERTSDEA